MILMPAWDRDNFVLRIWNHYERCDLIGKWAITTFARSSFRLLFGAKISPSFLLNNWIAWYISFHVWVSSARFYVLENFNAQINPVFECVTCNSPTELIWDLYRLLFNWSQQIGMTPKCWSIRDVMTIMVIQLINWNFLSVLWMTSLTPWMMIKLRVQMVSIYENCSEIFNWVKIFGIALVLHSFFYVHHARKSFDQNHSLFIKKKMKDENQWLFLTVYNFIQGYRPSLWMAKYHE